MTYIISSIIFLLSLNFISCSDSASFDGAKHGQKSSDIYEDRDSADIPTAVAGGMYLFKCKHDTLDSETTECSLLSKNNNKKVQLDEHFSSARINVQAPEGVKSIITENNDDYKSHWSIQLLNDYSDLTKKEIFKNTDIRLLVNDADSDEETSFSTNSTISSEEEPADALTLLHNKAKENGFKSVEFEGNFYVQTKPRKSCKSACNAMELKPNLSRKVDELHADANKCKKIFEKLGYRVDRVHYEEDGTDIGRAIKLSVTARGYGCNRSKWPLNPFDKNYYFSITKDYVRSADTGLLAVKGTSVCSCE